MVEVTPQNAAFVSDRHPGEPLRPTSLEEVVRLLRERADLGRRAGFEYPHDGPLTQAALYGIAGQLEYIAEFLEDSAPGIRAPYNRASLLRRTGGRLAKVTSQRREPSNG